MASVSKEELKAQLQHLQGRMVAFSEVMKVLGGESAKVAAFETVEDGASEAEQLVNSKELAMLSVEAVRACAMRVNELFEQARGEFEEIKAQLDRGPGLSRH